MTRLAELNPKTPFQTAAGHFGKVVARKGVRFGMGVLVDLEIDGKRVRKMLSGEVRVHVLPSLAEGCEFGPMRRMAGRKPDGYWESPVATHVLHAPVPSGQRRVS